MILRNKRPLAVAIGLVWLLVAEANPAAPDESIAVAADKAFDDLVAALASQNIVVVAAMRDAGIVRTGPVVVRNIDRSNIGLAFKCGATQGAGMAAPYDCMDFWVEYQFLIRSTDRVSSTLTVSATATAIDSRGLSRGLITDQSVVRILTERMRTTIVGSIAGAASGRAAQSPGFDPSKLPREGSSGSARPEWCRGDGYVWANGRCLCGAPGYVWDKGACSLRKTQ